MSPAVLIRRAGFRAAMALIRFRRRGNFRDRFLLAVGAAALAIWTWLLWTAPYAKK